VELLTNNFELEMVSFQRLLSRGLPTSQQPLYDEDFELDLTNSNSGDSVKRNVQVNTMANRNPVEGHPRVAC
jgi:hypothetical protein